MPDKTKKNNTVKQPMVALSDADKLFLAAMRSDDAQFAYVLALVCNRKPDSNIFGLDPQREVYTFESKLQADAFYGAVQQMIKLNKVWVQNLFEISADRIKLFEESVR